MLDVIAVAIRIERAAALEAEDFRPHTMDCLHFYITFFFSFLASEKE